MIMCFWLNIFYKILMCDTIIRNITGYYQNNPLQAFSVGTISFPNNQEIFPGAVTF